VIVAGHASAGAVWKPGAHAIAQQGPSCAGENLVQTKRARHRGASEAVADRLRHLVLARTGPAQLNAPSWVMANLTRTPSLRLFACARRGNQFLWGYDTSQDAELQEVFNFVVSRGINLFDTADSYGEVAQPTGRELNDVSFDDQYDEPAVLTWNSCQATRQLYDRWLPQLPCDEMVQALAD